MCISLAFSDPIPFPDPSRSPPPSPSIPLSPSFPPSPFSALYEIRNVALCVHISPECTYLWCAPELRGLIIYGCPTSASLITDPLKCVENRTESVCNVGMMHGSVLAPSVSAHLARPCCCVACVCPFLCGLWHAFPAVSGICCAPSQNEQGREVKSLLAFVAHRMHSLFHQTYALSTMLVRSYQHRTMALRMHTHAGSAIASGIHERGKVSKQAVQICKLC